jgi:hypothetical protein
MHEINTFQSCPLRYKFVRMYARIKGNFHHNKWRDTVTITQNRS